MIDCAAANLALRDFMNVIRNVPVETLKSAFNDRVAQAVIILRTRALVEDAIEKQKREWEKRSEKASRIADLIIDNIKNKGDCTEDDLMRAGFTEDEISDLKVLAYGLVATRMPAHKTLN